MVQIFIPKVEQLTVRDGGDRVILLNGHGEKVVGLPYEAALALSKAIRIQAKRVEERAKAQTISNDQAVLLRAGFPIGLSSNPDILKEAAKTACYDRNLRRYMPLNKIESTAKIFTPRIVKHKPKGGNNEL